MRTETLEKIWLKFEVSSEVEQGEEGAADVTHSTVVELEGVRIDDIPAADFKAYLLNLIINS